MIKYNGTCIVKAVVSAIRDLEFLRGKNLSSVKWGEGGRSCGANTIVHDRHHRHGVI